MTRPLLITVACGYIVALVCFAIAFAIAGPSLAPWSWHGDWDRRHAHFEHGRFFVFIDGFWCGLDTGFYPWDYLHRVGRRISLP